MQFWDMESAAADYLTFTSHQSHIFLFISLFAFSFPTHDAFSYLAVKGNEGGGGKEGQS